jgi:hypothetical protein
LILKTGYEITSVNNDLFISINDYIKSCGISGTLYYGEIVRIINSHPGIEYVDNLVINITMRKIKGAAAGNDVLDINGSGETDSGDTDVNWVNQLKTNLGTAYAAAVWNWGISATRGIRYLDWSPPGAEPVTGQPYWMNVDVKADILTPEDIFLVLSGVSFTL